MPDDPLEPIDQVLAELLQPEWYKREELCSQLGIAPDLFEICLQWDIVQPSHTNQEGEDLFSIDTLHRLGRGIRLHRDLGINWAGVVIALELLDRIDELERR